MKEFLSPLFFVTKIKVIREGWMGSWKEDSLPFKGGSKFVGSETKNDGPHIKAYRALSLRYRKRRSKNSKHSNMDLNIQGIMLYYNQTKI
ncbi:hypothetical protein ABIE66_000172 [Peribacillus sp. B2I2]